MIQMQVQFILVVLIAVSNFGVDATITDDVPALNPCDSGCPKIIDPVCGSDGDTFKLFHNMCLLEQQNCQQGRVWTEANNLLCISHNIVARSMCVRPCPFIFYPVCGFDGQKYRMFENECIYEMENCLADSKWRLAKVSECEESLIN